MSKNVLNNGQLGVLKLLYKYRYGSIDLLRASLGMKHNSGLYQKLEVLIKYGYVDKYYQKSYRLLGLPAAYHLLPKAYKVLAQLEGYDVPDNIVKAAYRDNARSSVFITHFLQVYASLNKLSWLYPNIKSYTGRELSGYDSFPMSLPDAYLSLDIGSETKRYFLDIIPDGTPRYVIDKLVASYHEFFLDDTWSDTGSDLPALLILSESGKSERYHKKLLSSKRNALDMVEPNFYTSTLTALNGSSAGSDAIWTEIDNPEDLMALPDIS